MKLISNSLEGMWAVPNHPYTCANPAPWQIEEIKIEHRHNVQSRKFEVVVWIRNESKNDGGSMWFNSASCFVHNEEECVEYCNINNINPT